MSSLFGPRFFFAFFLLIPLISPAQTPHPQPNRVATQAISAARTRLRGHLPSWASASVNASAVPDETPVRLTFALTRSPEREAAFTQLLLDQQTPGSASYHHWLTPRQIGDLYGPTQQDLGTLTAWMTSQGLRVVETAPSRTFVTVEAPAGIVGHALGTSFRNVELTARDGHVTSHLTATADPSIPSAFVPLIAAIDGLSDTPVEPMHHLEVVPASTSLEAPQLTSSTGTHYVTPGDFTVLYDVASVYNSGLTGTGQKIAIIGRSRVNPTDISAYQALIGQPTKQPNVIVPPTGTDPGTTGTGDQSEATLDVQRVLGTVPGAQADLVISNNLMGPIQYNIQTLLDPVMTISFGACEAQVSAASITTYNTLFSQAAAEGISIFVSSGDSGVAGCDTHGAAPPASQVASINYLCSSSYVTCVGGTEFADTANPTAYWSSTNSAAKVSVLSYIPEGAWNDPTNTDGTTVISATGGGVSIYTAKPSYQAGTGVPADGMRDTPDLSFTAARHDPYFGCYAQTAGGSGSCVPNPSTGAYSFVGFSGTSASAPSMAAITALLDQKLGGPQGNLNPLIYRLAATTPSAFHDATIASSGVTGCKVTTPSMCNNSTPGPTALTGGLAGFTLATGYDLATGWGSLDVANFLNLADNYQLSTTSTSLSLTAGATTGNTTTISLTPTGTFKGTVNLACSVSYNGAGTPAFLPTCAFANSAILVTAPASATTTLTISTTLPHRATAAAQASLIPHTTVWSMFGEGGAALAGLMLCFAPVRRRISWRAMSLLLLASIAMASFSGCSGGGGSTTTPPVPVGTTPGSYTVTVTASSTVTGAPTPAPITLALTVN